MGLGRRKVLLGKPGITHPPLGGPPDLREGFRIKRRSRTVADGVAGTTPAYGHGLRLLWYQARVAPPLPSTLGPSILIRRVLLRVLLVAAPSLSVWLHGQHREVTEGGVPFRPVSLAGCHPRGAWEPVPIGQFEVTPFKLISSLIPKQPHRLSGEP